MVIPRRLRPAPPPKPKWRGEVTLYQPKPESVADHFARLYPKPKPKPAPLTWFREWLRVLRYRA